MYRSVYSCIRIETKKQKSILNRVIIQSFYFYFLVNVLMSIDNNACFYVKQLYIINQHRDFQHIKDFTIPISSMFGIHRYFTVFVILINDQWDGENKLND